MTNTIIIENLENIQIINKYQPDFLKLGQIEFIEAEEWGPILFDIYETPSHVPLCRIIIANDQLFLHLAIFRLTRPHSTCPDQFRDNF